MIEKILERLEDYKYTHLVERDKESLEHCTENDKAEHCEGIDCFWCVWDNAIQIVQSVAQEYGDGWIPVEDRLPEDCDSRFYMCIVENHEEDLPMYCQYEEEYGFGFWHDYYDEHTLGFVDSEFRTNEELGYEKVIAWRQVPAYQPKGE